MADPVADALNELKTTVEELDDVVEGNNLLLDNLGEFMRTHANDAAAIRSMGDRLITDKQSISEAVARNTPADPNAGGPENPPIPPGQSPRR